MSDSLVSLPGYVLLQYDRPEPRPGGGVALFIKYSIPHLAGLYSSSKTPVGWVWIPLSSMISQTLRKILFISLLMTPPSSLPSVVPQTGKQHLLPSLQIWVKSKTGPTRGTCLSILTNLTLSLCLSKRTV